MYTRDFFLKKGVDPVPVENYCRLHLPGDVQFLVWRLNKAPQILRDFCGDEEAWIVVCKSTEDLSSCGWLFYLISSIDEPDEYELDGVRIFVSRTKRK